MKNLILGCLLIFLPVFCFSAEQYTKPDGTVYYNLNVDEMGNLKVNISTNVASITISDQRWLNKSVAGVQADLTASATVYFYGYGTSYLVTAEGGDVYYTPSWGGGQKRVATGTGIGDSGFEVPADSPTYISCVLQAGTTAGVILRGVINK